MTSLETVVKNPTGLHARPAAQLAAFCKQFPNDIRLSSGEKTCNPKSIFNLLSNCFKVGDPVCVTVDGDDSDQVADRIVAFIDTLEE